MKGLVGHVMAMESHRPYVAMLFIQFVYAGNALFSKAAITEGMNPYVFVVYRQACACLALAPFAFLLERLTPTHTHASLFCSQCLSFHKQALLNFRIFFSPFAGRKKFLCHTAHSARSSWFHYVGT